MLSNEICVLIHSTGIIQRDGVKCTSWFILMTYTTRSLLQLQCKLFPADTCKSGQAYTFIKLSVECVCSQSFMEITRNRYIYIYSVALHYPVCKLGKCVVSIIV